MEIKNFINNHSKEFIDDLSGLIKIPSVKSQSLTGMPFGEEIFNALLYIQNVSERLGFKFNNLDNYLGYVDFGSGEEMLGVLVHLDVVPADGFSRPSFGAQIIDGRIYGRGAIDNKGPAVAALYALFALKNSGFTPNKTIRLIFGCDEESGWADIDYYRSRQRMPDMGFSPDGDYPVVNAEKGILHVEVTEAVHAGQSDIILESITAGVAHNVVPHSAQCVIMGNLEAVRKYAAGYESVVPIEIIDNAGSLLLKFTGKSAHASTPNEGISAVQHMFGFLSGLSCDKNAAINTLFKRTGFSLDGSALGIRLCDDRSGELTVCITDVRLNGDALTYVFDIRYPVTFEQDDILDRLRKTLEPASIKVISSHAPHYVDEQSDLVQSLLEVYNEVAGEPAFCKAVGGGTYARAIPMAVTFGASFPDSPELAHQPDEYAVIDELILNIEIIAHAMKKLSL